MADGFDTSSPPGAASRRNARRLWIMPGVDGRLDAGAAALVNTDVPGEWFVLEVHASHGGAARHAGGP